MILQQEIAIWDFNGGLGTHKRGENGPASTEVDDTELRVVMNFIRALNRKSELLASNRNILAPSSWPQRKERSIGAVLGRVFEFMNKSPLEIISDITTPIVQAVNRVDIRDYEVRDEELDVVILLNQRGTKSSVGTGLLEDQKIELAQKLRNEGAYDHLDPDLPIFCRPPYINSSALAKGVYHAISMIQGKRTIALDDDPYALMIIYGMIKEVFKKDVPLICTISKSQAETYPYRRVPELFRKYIMPEPGYRDYDWLVGGSVLSDSSGPLCPAL